MAVRIIVEYPRLAAKVWDLLWHGGRASDLELLKLVAQMALQSDIEVVFERYDTMYDCVKMTPDEILSAIERGSEFRLR